MPEYREVREAESLAHPALAEEGFGPFLLGQMGEGLSFFRSSRSSRGAVFSFFSGGVFGAIFSACVRAGGVRASCGALRP